MRTSRLVRHIVCTSLALVAPACVGLPEDDASTGQPILNGAPGSATTTGVVLVQRPGGLCSATLLTNNWAVSAAHCFTAAEVSDPSRVTVSLGAVTQRGAEVLLHPTLDVAMVRLAAPHTMNGSTRGWEANFFAGPLVGRTVRCMGYGRNTYTDGSGTLRQADVRVVMSTQSPDPNLFTVVPNGSGQVPWLGDSGGPCFVTMPGGIQLVAGVLSTAWHNSTTQQVLEANYVSAHTFRAWAAELLTTKELVLRHSRLCVEARNWLPGNGPIQQHACDGGADQRWRFEPAGATVAGESYRLRDTATGRCLTVPNGQVADGVALMYFPCSTTAMNQRFVLRDMGGGFRQLINVQSARCLDVPSNSTTVGVGLQQYTCHTGANQQFEMRVHADDGGAFEVTALHSAKCLDVPSSSLASGARIQQSLCNLGSNQRFRVEEVANGEFRVRPQNSGLCFDIPDGSTADRAPVQQYPCHNGPNQRFRVLYQAPGRYQLQNVNSGRCLDVPSASTADGVAIQQSGCHTGANQSWVIRL
jgi:hypothetical protein